jgi:hypothetical protein
MKINLRDFGVRGEDGRDLQPADNPHEVSERFGLQLIAQGRALRAPAPAVPDPAAPPAGDAPAGDAPAGDAPAGAVTHGDPATTHADPPPPRTRRGRAARG